MLARREHFVVVFISAEACLLLLLLLGFVSAVSCGEEDKLTQEEIELVKQFRPMVKDLIYKEYMSEDEYLVRFLRVRDYNMESARDMVAKAMQWRKQNKMDSILTEDVSEVEREFPIFFEGTDNYGRPIMLVNIGIVDLRKIVLAGQVEKYLRYFEFMLELGESYGREIRASPSGFPNVSRLYLIGDFNGFNLRQHACVQCLPFIPRIFQTYESYYPDRLYRVLAVNTPRSFLPIFELIRPFLSVPTSKAVQLLDHNSDKWKSFLLNEIPADQLPKPYGGSKPLLPKTLVQLRKVDPLFDQALSKAFAEKEETEQKLKS